MVAGFCINTGSDNDLLPDGTTMPEPMLPISREVLNNSIRSIDHKIVL